MPKKEGEQFDWYQPTKKSLIVQWKTPSEKDTIKEQYEGEDN